MEHKKQIYINLIVTDLEKSTRFYEAIGCIKNPVFSNEVASAMVWSNEIIFMLLTETFARHFNDGKDIADSKKTVGALYALSLGSKKDVDHFCENAQRHGGRVYVNTFNQNTASEFMYTFEVEDPDGYILEPTYMDMSQLKK